MKKYCFILFSFILCAACDDIPSSKLIGKWQMKTVEKNGVISSVDTVWYNFQSESIFSVQVYFPQHDTIWFTTGLKTQIDNVITIEIEPGSYDGYIDWDNAFRSFSINKLNKKNLILLSEEGYTYSFIKF